MIWFWTYGTCSTHAQLSKQVNKNIQILTVVDNVRKQQGPVSRKSRELFRPEKPVVKLQSTSFEKLIF